MEFFSGTDDPSVHTERSTSRLKKTLRVIYACGRRKRGRDVRVLEIERDSRRYFIDPLGNLAEIERELSSSQMLLTSIDEKTSPGNRPQCFLSVQKYIYRGGPRQHDPGSDLVCRPCFSFQRFMTAPAPALNANIHLQVYTPHGVLRQSMQSVRSGRLQENS